MITMLMSVGAGGAFGAITRYLIGAVLVDRFGASSWVGTLFVNIAGCIVMGGLAALIRKLWHNVAAAERVFGYRVSGRAHNLFKLCA